MKFNVQFELYQICSNRFLFSRQLSRKLFQTMLDIMREELLKGNSVDIPNVGRLKHFDSKNGRRTIKLRLGYHFKQRINNELKSQKNADAANSTDGSK